MPRPDLAGAALALAACGYSVFRVRPNDKRPLRLGWQGEATSDLARVTRLWRDAPTANIGLACGPSCWALDIDGEAGLATLADLEEQHGWLPIGPASVTGGGGEHLLFAPDERVKNSVRRLGDGLDTRGSGGFVVVPPSIHPSGSAYQWLPGREPWAVSLPAAPPWLLDLLDPPKVAAAPEARPFQRRMSDSGYVIAAVERELAAVAQAGNGNRNYALFKAAAGLGRFTVDGRLLAPDLKAALLGCALAAGLPEHEARRTIDSGLGAAARKGAAA